MGYRKKQREQTGRSCFAYDRVCSKAIEHDILKSRIMNHAITENPLYQKAAELMIHQGHSADEARRILLEEEQEKEPQIRLITDALEQEKNKAVKKDKARKDMLYGGLWFGGGVAVTALSYVFAEPGGSYMLAYGAVIFGAIQFVKGLVKYG